MSDLNYILLTLDSCRYDAFIGASLGALGERTCFLPAYAPATYTFPSHSSMFQGVLPDSREPIPLYNRFITQIWRRPNQPHEPKLPTVADLRHTPSRPPRTFCQTLQHDSVPKGLAASGYATIGVAAMGWFRHPLLTSQFDRFLYTGTNAPAEFEFARAELKAASGRPFFLFMNFGETHAPYCFGDEIGTPKYEGLHEEYERLKREQQPKPGQPVSLEYLHRQRRTVEYLAVLIEEFLAWVAAFAPGTLVVLCGDHGDVMGEDNLWGHGFYHPAVMEVPLGIFSLGPERLPGLLAPHRKLLEDCQRRHRADALRREQTGRSLLSRLLRLGR